MDKAADKNDTPIYFSIKQVSIIFNARANLLSSYCPQDLYDAFKEIPETIEEIPQPPEK